MAQQPLYRQYLEQARHLARLDRRRPRQGNLRRVISTAYYALFHFLIDQSSHFIVGRAWDRESLRKLLGRAYTHTEMAAVARTFRGGTLPATILRALGSVVVPREVGKLADQFIEAQDERHLAEYDLSTSWMRGEVLDLIDAIEQRIEEWKQVRKEPVARLFLVCLLVWDKIRNK